jgi:ribosomal protein L24E
MITDGFEIVDTATFPPSGFRSLIEKQKWGEEVLKGYLIQQHGRVIFATDSVCGKIISRGMNPRRLTGTSAMIGKKYYMLIEPRDNHHRQEKVVHIVRRIEDFREGGLTDYVELKAAAAKKQPKTSLGEAIQAALAAKHASS